MKKLVCVTSLMLAFGAAHAADIVDTAKSAGNFTTLVKAVEAAGLGDTLKGPGPYTVFAPTDAAFAKVPKDKLDALLKDKAALTKVVKLPADLAVSTISAAWAAPNASMRDVTQKSFFIALPW